MYEFVPLNISKSFDEYTQGRFAKELDVADYISAYPYLKDTNIEVLCLTILKDNPGIVLKNVPLEPVLLSDIIHSDMTGHLVNLDCVVRKTGEVKMEMKSPYIMCKKCGWQIGLVTQDQIVNGDPTQLSPSHPCDMCGGRSGIIVPEKCQYVDSQYITVQELQEHVSHGKQPKSLVCVLREKLVDTVTAGSRVRLTGTVNLKYEKGVFSSLYLNVVGVSSIRESDKEVSLSEEDIDTIRRLGSDPNIYDLLAESICPLVYGYHQVKRGILFQIFGGTTIDLEDGAHIRGNSHVLLCGDPGLAKSKLLSSVSYLVPNSVYTSGKSSSAAGLTAAAVKDEVDGKWVLEAGALPLADGGVAVVDELDKMTPEDRSALHEAMEQQTITVNKAGISAQLFTRCSLLAAANPSMGKFDKTIDLKDQVELPPSLISRFDLIYMMTDDPDRDTDLAVANHILNSRRNSELIAKGESALDSVGVKKPVNSEMFRKYLMYAKRVVPVITDEVIQILRSEYVSLRAERRVTPRQLEALIRLAESSARIRLSQTVTAEDAHRALSLFTTSLESINLKTDDVGSKNLCMSLIPVGGISLPELVQRVMSHSFMTEDAINNELYKLVTNGKIKLNRIGKETTVMKV